MPTWAYVVIAAAITAAVITAPIAVRWVRTHNAMRKTIEALIEAVIESAQKKNSDGNNQTP
ncbi:MAG: hypothetical protein IRZ06_12650 [Nevskia sp.]|nr:hypothetical protein [Nevskia sp.]